MLMIKRSHYKTNGWIVGPHSIQLCMLSPEHMLDCRRCLDRWGLTLVRWAAQSPRGWTPVMGRLVRMLPHPIPQRRVTRMPLP